jgi:RNA polymerase sigma-70 factor, ECF subfamily
LQKGRRYRLRRKEGSPRDDQRWLQVTSDRLWVAERVQPATRNLSLVTRNYLPLRSAYLCMSEKQPHFEELLLPHLDGAYNLARWLIEKDQDAQAIVHEAYLQALQEFTKFRGADARTWLLTIVRKTAYTWIQKGGTGSKVVPLAEAFAEGSSAATKAMADKSEKPLPEATDQESKRSLYEALSRLPVEFREILVLHDIEGWTYTQLASVLGISPAMVLNRLSMAREACARTREGSPYGVK